MIITEFKAFLEGMDVQDCPTKEQWVRIKEKIDLLEAIKPVDLSHLIDQPVSTNIPFGTGTPLPMWPYATCNNMASLGPVASAAIFDDLDGLYES